jgi:hypothetical protein
MSNVIYDGPGKCRKKCPCGLYLHARSSFCRTCNHEFKPGAIEKFNKLQGDVVETYENRGRGKKKCTQCEKYVGCRITVCSCGFNFELQAKPDKGPVVDEELRKYAAALGVPNYRVIITPCGGPPKAPKSLKKQDVLNWIDNNLFGKQDSVLSVHALRYRLRQLYSGKELNKVKKSLQEWYEDVRDTN